MDYTQKIIVAPNTDIDTIEKAINLINTTDPIIYIKKGEYNIYSLVSMSKKDINITYIGDFKDTIIYINNPASGTNFINKTTFKNIRFKCSDTMPAYWNNYYVMAYFVNNSTEIIFENCIFDKSNNKLKPNWVFIFLCNTTTSYVSNIYFINCTFNQESISDVFSCGHAHFKNCLYNAQYFINGANEDSICPLDNVIKDDIDQETFKPLNVPYNSVGAYCNLNYQTVSNTIKNKVKSTILNNKLFEKYCVPYEEEQL